jgi:hypothetical protein
MHNVATHRHLKNLYLDYGGIWAEGFALKR